MRLTRLRAIARRLERLEGRLEPAEETWQERQLRARLEAARRRAGLPSPTREERDNAMACGSRSVSLADRLIAARRRAEQEEQKDLLAAEEP